MLPLHRAESLARLSGLTRAQCCALWPVVADAPSPLAALRDLARAIGEREAGGDGECHTGMRCRLCDRRRVVSRGLCWRCYQRLWRRGEVRRYARRNEVRG